MQNDDVGRHACRGIAQRYGNVGRVILSPCRSSSTGRGQQRLSEVLVTAVYPTTKPTPAPARPTSPCGLTCPSKQHLSPLRAAAAANRAVHHHHCWSGHVRVHPACACPPAAAGACCAASGAAGAAPSQTCMHMAGHLHRHAQFGQRSGMALHTTGNPVPPPSFSCLGT